MSYVLTIYSKEIYQDFILPAIDNADYTIVLQQKIFSLSDDVLVRMEIVDGEWRFVQGENYRIVKNGKSYIRKGLHNGEALNLELFNTLNFAVMIQEKTGGFTVYKKYLLPPEGKIYIGKNKDNHIYDSMGLVSGIHASIEMNHMNYILRDMSRNGVYVNHNRIKQMHVLQYGDTINIIGLKMVFLGNFLALEKPGGSFRIKEDCPTGKRRHYGCCNSSSSGPCFRKEKEIFQPNSTKSESYRRGTLCYRGASRKRQFQKSSLVSHSRPGPYHGDPHDTGLCAVYCRKRK